jgi:hypothetical protein
MGTIKLLAELFTNINHSNHVTLYTVPHLQWIPSPRNFSTSSPIASSAKPTAEWNSEDVSHSPTKRILQSDD